MSKPKKAGPSAAEKARGWGESLFTEDASKIPSGTGDGGEAASQGELGKCF